MCVYLIRVCVCVCSSGMWCQSNEKYTQSLGIKWQVDRNFVGLSSMEYFSCFISIHSLNDDRLENFVPFVILSNFLFTFRCDFIVMTELPKANGQIVGLKISALCWSQILFRCQTLQTFSNPFNQFQVGCNNLETVRPFGTQLNAIAMFLFSFTPNIWFGLLYEIFRWAKLCKIDKNT